MTSVARSMRVALILFLMLFLAAPAWASHEAGQVGDCHVSFDMNTTLQYTVIVQGPSSGVTSSGAKFTRYNLTVNSADYFASMVLTRYDEPVVANITADEYIVLNALQLVGADQPNLYQVPIDGQPGVLGSFRFKNIDLGEGRYQQGDIVVAACYSPDGAVSEDGIYRGKTDCRIISTYSWEIIRDMLYTLHVEVPKDESVSVPENQS